MFLKHECSAQALSAAERGNKQEFNQKEINTPQTNNGQRAT